MLMALTQSGSSSGPSSQTRGSRVARSWLRLWVWWPPLLSVCQCRPFCQSVSACWYSACSAVGSK